MPVRVGATDRSPGLAVVGDSSAFRFHYRPGLFLATRYLRRHAVPIHESPLELLPQLSRRMIRFALWIYPRFLDRADLAFPIIIAGRGWYQIALDGRHRISKAIWTNHPSLPTVRVPWIFAIELLLPPVFTAEWLFLFARKELRRSGRHPPRHDR
ncbi:MAG TPA: hypothetical protein VMG36_06630 [Thermoplasmata archaeon]|nr:hypothetical protein [Thermoplasmata archaeon]